MLMTFKRLGFWLLALVVTATPATAQDRSAAERLADELRNYRTYQAEFVQTVSDGQGHKIQEVRGELKAKRPGLFYWETREPMTQFIVADGDKVEVYDPDLDQVTIHPMDQQMANTPAMLLSGKVNNLEETYQVTYRTFGGKTTEYTLAPRNPDSLFVSLTMTFYEGELQEMRLQDSLDQRSVLRFDDITVNDAIPDSAFDMDYPENVDVIQGNS
jgi:outer membrane lipoprotein carrier protein